MFQSIKKIFDVDSDTIDRKENNEIENRKNIVFLFISSLFLTALILTNLISNKVCYIPFSNSELATFPGLFMYPITFLCSDITCELFGKKRSKAMVWAGFAMSFFSVICIQTAVAMTPHPLWAATGSAYGTASEMDCQAMYATIFSAAPKAVFASMFAYLISQQFDVTLFCFLKKITKGKHAWIRNNVSTMTSQLVDTFVHAIAFFYLGMKLPLDQVMIIGLTAYSLKFICAALDTPFFYFFVWLSKRYIYGGKLLSEVRLKTKPIPA